MDQPPLNVLFLAAGYGSRMERGLQQDATGQYRHLIGVPKPLLPVAGRPLIEYWFDALLPLVLEGVVQSVFVVTNGANHQRFVEWAEARRQRATCAVERNLFNPEQMLINDRTTSNDNRLGALVDIELSIQAKSLRNSDIVVVAGDTLFCPRFFATEMPRLLNEFRLLQQQHTGPDAIVLSYQMSEGEDIRKRGILETIASSDNGRSRVVRFLEKPNPQQTESRLACPPFYVLSSRVVQLLSDFITEKTGPSTPLDERDAPGKFIAWLVNNTRNHDQFRIEAALVSGRFDIGNLPEYLVAQQFWSAVRIQSDSKC